MIKIKFRDRKVAKMENKKTPQSDKIGTFVECKYCKHKVHKGNYCEQCGYKLFTI